MLGSGIGDPRGHLWERNWKFQKKCENANFRHWKLQIIAVIALIALIALISLIALTALIALSA